MKFQNLSKIIIILILILFLTACTKSNLPKLTSEECTSMNGVIINTLSENCPSEDIIGEITDLKCPCVCCKK